MSILAWIILGGFAGWIASMITNSNKSMGVILNIIAGIVGATVGGWVYGLFGGEGVTGFNWHSFFVAIVGAVIVIAVVKLLRK